MRLVPPSSWSLSVKLPVIVCLVVVGVAAVIGVGVVTKDRSELREALSDRALLLSQWVSAGVADAVLRNDNWAAYRVLRQVSFEGGHGGNELITAMVLDRDGKVIAHLHPGDNPIGLLLPATTDQEANLLESALATQVPKVLTDGAGGFIEGVTPVFASGKYVGVVRVRLSTQELNQATWESAWVAVGLTLGLAILGSLVGIWLSLGAVRPLRTLSSAMAQLGRGEHLPVDVEGGDEIAQLGVAFNDMADEVAEKQRLERELAQSEKAAALGRIAAGVAHEVNNPLAGILNCLSTIKDHPEQPELVTRYLPPIEKGLHRIRAIIQDLLVEQRAEHAVELCGPGCLDELRELMAAEIEGTCISLAWDNRVDGSVLINRPRLQQAVLNLLKNAAQAMPDGGQLRFSAWLDGIWLRIEVQDSGSGIAPEDLRHIFDPFFSSRKGGTGLGLWITLRLLNSMGGSIDVSSAPGEGSLFRLHVPIEGESNGTQRQ